MNPGDRTFEIRFSIILFAAVAVVAAVILRKLGSEDGRRSTTVYIGSYHIILLVLFELGMLT
jgi:hypothetical protein